MHWIKAAEYKKDYEILLEFENGNVKVADLENHLNNGILRDLRNKAEFSKVNWIADTDTIEWENGADFSPWFPLRNMAALWHIPLLLLKIPVFFLSMVSFENSITATGFSLALIHAAKNRIIAIPG